MRTLGRSVVAVVVLTLVFGLAYPLLFTGFAQLVFPGRADGSLIERDGTVVGSRLAAQEFTKPEYFHPRPSAHGARVQRRRPRPSPTSAPRTPTSRQAVRERATAILELERPYNPGLEIGDIPVDAVTTSGSGIDPHISPANAQLQTARVAEVRGLSRRARRGADRRRDRRPLARDLRRARRERARAQPRAGRGDGRRDDAQRRHLHARDRLRGDPRLVREARPADARPQPGHLHRRARQRHHDRDLLPRPLRRGRLRSRSGSPARSRSGSG